MARQIDYDLNVNADNAVRTIGQIESELSQVNSELREVDTTGDSFDRLSQRSQSLTSELQGVNTQIEGFTSQRRQDALQGTIDIFTGSIEVISGLSAALGVQDERLERVLVRLLAVGQAANGIRTVTAGFIALTRATNVATASATRFNLVTRRNALILAASIAAAGVAYLVLNEDIDETTDAINDNSEAIQRNIDRAIDANELILLLQRRQLDIIAEQQGTESNLNAQRVFFAQDNIDRINQEITDLRLAGAFKEEIVAAEMRRNIALADLQEQLHQGNLLRIREEMEAEVILADLEERLVDSRIDIASGLGDFLTTVAGENEELAIAGLIVEQAAAVAGVVIDTIRTNQGITAQGALAAIPTAGASVAAAAGLVTANTIVSGVAIAGLIAQTVQGINSIRSGNTAGGVAGAGGSSGVAFGPTVATPAAAPQTSIGVVQGTGQPMQSVIAVVASGEIRNDNERSARVRRKTRLNRTSNG